MHTKIIFLLLVITTLVSESQASSQGQAIATLIKIGLNVILGNLKRMGDVILIPSTNKVTVDIPDGLHEFAIGSVTLKNTQIQGLGSMRVNTCDAKDVEIADADRIKTSIAVDVNLNQFGLFTDYDIDVGIIDEIPVYGVGEVKLALSKTNITVNVNLNMRTNFSDISISDLDIQLYFRDSPSHITGFWKNEDASNIVTGALNILEKFFCMWFDYERTNNNCVISNVVEYVINRILGKKTTASKKYECIKHSKYNVLENLERMALFYENGTFPEYFTSSLARRDLRKICTDTMQVIVEILGEDEVLKQML